MDKDKDKVNKYFKLFNKTINNGNDGNDGNDELLLNELNELWATMTDKEKSIAYDKIAPLRKRLSSKSGAQRPS